MLFLGNPSSVAIRAAMTAGEVGCMITPAQGSSFPLAAAWAADSGCGPDKAGRPGGGFPGYEAYMGFLGAAAGRDGSGAADLDASRCLFATAPDVPFDAGATLARYAAPYRMLGVIRHVLGLPAAFVAQDGMAPSDPPWEDLDVLFVGGSKRWKASGEARLLVLEARERGKGTHLGMVNTLQWLRFAVAEGYDSCDGTTFARGVDKSLGAMLRWLARPEVAGGQAALW